MAITEIDVSELDQYLKSGAQLVDVRETQELSDEGSIPGHKHMPLSRFEEFKSQISKSSPTVFYCRSGKRSMKAADIASQWTSQELFSLRGGILAYHASRENAQ